MSGILNVISFNDNLNWNNKLKKDNIKKI
jgi:hypothetical protein